MFFCIALGGSTKGLDAETGEIIRHTEHVLFCPDFDSAGKRAWEKWKGTYPNSVCILTPKEKSPGDAYCAGVNLREWIKGVLP